jgi:hypothetical protein
MKTHHLKKFILFSILLGLSQVSFAACDQTLSAGANVASAVSSAANGTTICLNGGDYGAVNLLNIIRSGFVTLQSAVGVSAQMAPQVVNSRYIKFVNMTLTSTLVKFCSTHIHFIGDVFVPNAPGLLFTNHGSSCPAGSQDYLVDSTRFADVAAATYQARLALVTVNGAVVRNSTFSGVSPVPPQGDGIQLLGGSTNVMIGPNNIFTGILQSLCSTSHCDAIQDYGAGPNNVIDGNYFEKGDTFLMFPDGSTSVIVTNNVFDGSGAASYPDKIQFGSANSPIFRHNTLRNVRASFDSKPGNPASTNVQAQNNILINGSSWKTTYGSGCSSCAFSYNLFDAVSNASGMNNLIGTPTFIGGSSPSTLAGWQLTSSSLSYRAASDGKDMGANSFSPGTGITQLAAPTNLPVQ